MYDACISPCCKMDEPSGSITVSLLWRRKPIYKVTRIFSGAIRFCDSSPDLSHGKIAADLSVRSHNCNELLKVLQNKLCNEKLSDSHQWVESSKQTVKSQREYV